MQRPQRNNTVYWLARLTFLYYSSLDHQSKGGVPHGDVGLMGALPHQSWTKTMIYSFGHMLIWWGHFPN